MRLSFLRSSLALFASCVSVTALSQGCSSDSGADGTDPASDGGTFGADSASDAGGGGQGSFRVGGKVMGLRGSGLVLVNRWDRVVIPADPAGGDVSFTFPTRLPAGADFDVVVVAQPSSPTQTCVVTGGKGSVAAGDVLSVAVNCTANTYTVGGTVTGLVGKGLVLTNNDGPELTVNGSVFAFPEKVTSGEPYSVKVKADPTDPWQACTVDAPASGTVTTSSVSVNVTCATKSFSVKGVVKGLHSNGLALSQGADVLPVAPAGDGSDVPFVFPTKLSSGASYAVTVSGTPAGALCTVTSGATGTIAGADADVVVTCECTPGSVAYESAGAATVTLPACVSSVTIEAFGAEGGTSTGQQGGRQERGGRGARVRGTFQVAPGDVFEVIAGERGADGSCGAGGGGGSFVSRAGTLLLAAGGGGGGFHCDVLGPATGGDGRVETSGGGGICTTMPGYVRLPRPGGVDGEGGSSFFGGGGGGWLGAGVGSLVAASGGAAAGGAGGSLGGGLGGGGGHYASCCGGSGGGGGYSGGSGGQIDGCAGGGGGSYNTGSDPSAEAGVREGHGRVVFSW